VQKRTTKRSNSGRHTKYCAELAEKICALLMEGYSLRKICARYGMPDKSTVCRWLAHEPTFRDQYARAREIQAELLADEILDIADDGTNDYVERETADGNTRILVDHDHINRSRLRVDARKWVAEKLLPKKYGAKKAIEHTGPDGATLAPSLKVRFVNASAAVSIPGVQPTGCSKNVSQNAVVTD